jgi:hypothetical protein
MKKILLSTVLIATLALTAQAKTAPTSENQVHSATSKTTKVTPKNYGLAETQEIMTGYVKKIAKATGTDGVGIIMNVRKGADPKDKTIMRINFDTIYSWIVLDLSEPATIVMPDVGGRYQTAWVISEEHYNPFAFDKPGEYILTKENVGTPYAIVVFRTQANVEDPKDMQAAHKAQDGLAVKQKSKGSYVASHKWNPAEIQKIRKHYQQIQKEKSITSDNMFGKKGERTLEEHNVGTSFGWGGFTKEQAVYPIFYGKNTKPQTFTLKDVPVKAFWSITVYDDDGFAQTDTYNINSQFAKKNADGSVTIHFGGDKKADNYMATFDNWNFALRLYQPTKDYFDGTWKKPELVEAK